MVLRVAELQEAKRDSAASQELINKIFEQSVQFLEQQHSFWPDHLNKLFEKVFFLSKNKNVHLKQRLFAVFEKFNGTSIFKKLQFFMQKHLVEDVQDKTALIQGLSQLLDFTLFNFKTNVPLHKIQLSSRLFPLSNIQISFD